jgi:pyruvate formate lyase activating enzyme
MEKGESLGLQAEPCTEENGGFTGFRAFTKISLLDCPNKIAAIVWGGGCNFKCPFCYNRDLVLNPENLPVVKEDEILSYLKSRRKWLDGLVITGGEPTIHADLPDFMKKVKKLGFSIKLDTNGSNPEALAELLRRRLVDYIAVDIKAPFIDERYQRAAGLKNGTHVLSAITKTIELLLNSDGVDCEFRTTAVPTLLRKEDFALIAQKLKGAKRYYIQQFDPTKSLLDESYSNVVPYSSRELEEIRQSVKGYFETCKVRE